MPYIELAIAIGAEIAATSFLKKTDGFTRPLPTLLCCAAYLACYFCLSRALKHIPLGPAYALWCGVGIVVTTLVSVLYDRAHLSLPAAVGIFLILVGCVLINLSE